jgi:hypothetical protein
MKLLLFIVAAVVAVLVLRWLAGAAERGAYSVMGAAIGLPGQGRRVRLSILPLLLFAASAHAQEPSNQTEAARQYGDAAGDERAAGDATPFPAIEAAQPPTEPPTDTLLGRMAAVGWCPVRTSKRDEPPAPEAAEEGDPAPQAAAEDEGCGLGMALRLSPRSWDPWAAGLFADQRHFGPWAGAVLLRTEGAAFGLGAGWRIRFDGDGIYLRRGDLVFGATVALVGLGGGGG